MIQAFCVRRGNVFGTTSARYFSAVADSGTQVYANGVSAHPWSLAGTFRNLVAYSTEALDVGNTYTLTLYLNGSPTSLVATIEAGATSGRDTTHEVTVAVGDILSFQSDLNGAAQTGDLASVIEFENSSEDASGYATIGGSLNDTATEYAGPLSGAYFQASWYDVCALDGAVTRMDVLLSNPPGSGKSYEFALYVNDVKQDGTGGTVDTRVTISGASADTGSATFTLPITAGDLIQYGCTPSNGPTPRSAALSMVFVSDEAEYALIAGGTADNLSASATEYNNVGLSRDGSWISTETLADYSIGGVSTFTLSRLAVWIQDAPGAGKSYQFVLRVNEAAPSGTPTLVIADSDIVGVTTTGSATITDGDRMTLECDPTGTPTVSTEQAWCLAQHIVIPATWVDIPNFVVAPINSALFPSGAGRILGYLWSEDADAVLKARLYNIDDAVSVGESAEVSGATPQVCDFTVALTSGTHKYKLQVTSDTPGTDIFFSGRGLGV